MILLPVSVVIVLCVLTFLSAFFFFNDTATTEIYTLSLHDALPIFPDARRRRGQTRVGADPVFDRRARRPRTGAREDARARARLRAAAACMRHLARALPRPRRARARSHGARAPREPRAVRGRAARRRLAPVTRAA